MQVYINDIITGIIAFPFLALLITVPYMVYQYRKFGSIPWWRTFIVYLFAFYCLCAYFLVILPLPESRDAFVPYAANPQFIPFNSFSVLIENSQVVWSNPSTWYLMFTDHNFYEIIFNILMLVPLGMFLRYYFKCSWWKCLIAGFCTSLFFELTQLSGLYGIYAHPYRLFDVDDLMMNTLGAMVGFWIMGPVLKWLPTMNALNNTAREHGVRASLTRRILAFLLDLFFLSIAAFLVALVAALLGVQNFDYQVRVGEVPLFTVSQIVLALIAFGIVPILTHGQTLGQKLLKLVVVRPDGSAASWYQYTLRYALLFIILSLPMWLLDGLTKIDSVKDTEFMAIFGFIQPYLMYLIVIFLVGFLSWLVSVLVRNFKAKKRGEVFALLNEQISGTRIMTVEGVKHLRDQRVVLDVEQIKLLEQMIAEDDASFRESVLIGHAVAPRLRVSARDNASQGQQVKANGEQHSQDRSSYKNETHERGASLRKLMIRAGHSVSAAIQERNPDPTSVLIVCGSGNNGGDGWVIAYDLATKKYDVTVVTPQLPGLLETEPAKEVAMDVFAESQKEDLPLRVVVAPNEKILSQELTKAEVVVDAVLGTGFSGKTIHAPYDMWIKAMNRHHKKRKDSWLVSVDVPSGYSAQTGAHAVPCIVADLTVTMLAYKPGLLGASAARFCGPIKLAPLVDITPYLDRLKQKD